MLGSIGPSPGNGAHQERYLMKEHLNTGTPGDRVGAAKRRLKRLKLASVATSVISFGALSASIAAQAANSPVVTASSGAATASSAAVAVSSNTTTQATTASPAATATPTVTQSTAPIVSAQS